MQSERAIETETKTQFRYGESFSNADALCNAISLYENKLLF